MKLAPDMSLKSQSYQLLHRNKLSLRTPVSFAEPLLKICMQKAAFKLTYY